MKGKLSYEKNKKIEKLIEEWKAKCERSLEFKMVESAKMEAHILTGIFLVLEIIEEPDNIRAQADESRWILWGGSKLKRENYEKNKRVNQKKEK